MARERGRTVIVSSVQSDSHTWNLVFLQLLIEELGYDVVNLGATVPDELLVSESLARKPELIVISSVNGHGYQDGLRVVRKLRLHAVLRDTPVVIGGKLGIAGGESDQHVANLLDAGFDAVFDDRPGTTAAFRRFAARLPERAARGLA
nr:cobalamin-dependent protein [Streptomyces sp. DSM 40907]